MAEVAMIAAALLLVGLAVVAVLLLRQRRRPPPGLGNARGSCRRAPSAVMHLLRAHLGRRRRVAARPPTGIPGRAAHPARPLKVTDGMRREESMKVDNEAGFVALLQANGDDLRSTSAMEAADRKLRASIAAHGLLEPLVVRRHDACVVAGHRRYPRALAATGEIADDAAVNCTILAVLRDVLREHRRTTLLTGHSHGFCPYRAHPGWLPKGFHTTRPETATPESA